MLSSTPSSVECWGSRHAHRRLEDIAHLRVIYDIPRVEANIHVSWLHPSKTRRVTAVGSKKMVVFDDLSTEERIRVHDKSVHQPDQLTDDLSQAPMSYRYGDVVAPYVAVNEPLSVEDQHFLDCVIHGGRPRTDGANGLAVVEVLEAAETCAPRAPARSDRRGRQRARAVIRCRRRRRGAGRARRRTVTAPVSAIPVQRAGVPGTVGEHVDRPPSPFST